MLYYLDLSHNQNLSRLPTAIWELKSLTDLDLSNCPKLEALPEILQPVEETLRFLDLSYCYNLKALPNNISHLKSLIGLKIMNCKLIHFIPTLPQSLRFLYANDCESLETLSVRSNCKIIEMSFTNCYKLDEKSRRKIIAHARIQLKNNGHCIIVLPGTEIPQGFPHRSVGSLITMPLPSNANHLLGLSSAIVFQNSTIHGKFGFLSLKLKCYHEFNTGIIFEAKMPRISLSVNVKSDHLLLGKFPSHHLNHYHEFRTRKEPLSTCSKALIELCLGPGRKYLVKQCGVDFDFGGEYSISIEEDCQKSMGEDALSKGGCDNYYPY